MTTFSVYHYRRDLTDRERVCDLGCKHTVTFHEHKRLTKAPEENYTALVKALNYTSDGYGTIRVAYDAQGRKYTQTPVWDGPAPWMREDGKTYWARPVLKMDAAFTLDGRPIK